MSNTQSAKEAINGACCLLVVVLILVGWVWSKVFSSRNSAAASSQQAQSNMPDLGSDCRVAVNGPPRGATVAISPEAEQKYQDALMGRDKIGITDLLVANQIWFAPNGTKVRVIGYGDFDDGVDTYHVRVESGDHGTEDGYLGPASVLKPWQ